MEGNQPIRAVVAAVDGSRLPLRFSAWLQAKEYRAPVLLVLHRPPRPLVDLLIHGAVVVCRVGGDRAYPKAFWIDSVQHKDEQGEWVEVWRSGREFREHSHDTAPRMLRDRPDSPSLSRDGEPVWGTVISFERVGPVESKATVLPDDGVGLVALSLRRAPPGVLTSFVKGARVKCLAAPHAADPSIRFSAIVLEVQLEMPDGQLRTVWRHEPKRVPVDTEE